MSQQQCSDGQNWHYFSLGKKDCVHRRNKIGHRHSYQDRNKELPYKSYGGGGGGSGGGVAETYMSLIQIQRDTHRKNVRACVHPVHIYMHVKSDPI